MKQNRQNAILDIISKNTIETQEQLIEKLTEAGYNVTQATVSRDGSLRTISFPASPSSAIWFRS